MFKDHTLILADEVKFSVPAVRMKPDDLQKVSHTLVIHSPCSGASAPSVSSGERLRPQRAAEVSQGAASSPSHQPSAVNYKAALRSVVISLSLCFSLLH